MVIVDPSNADARFLQPTVLGTPEGGTDILTGLITSATTVSWWDPQCCNERQKVFIVEYACLFVGSIILWRSRFLLPMKLFSVFLHELGHALMAWICCGSVSGIEVHSDQGGLTHFSGVGNYAVFWILPAGYLGSALWACAIVIMSGGDTVAVVISWILCAFLLITLVYSFIGDKERFGWALPLVCLFNLAVLSTHIIFLIKIRNEFCFK